MSNRLADILRSTRAYNCVDCGKCTATCPLPAVDSDYAPRRTVSRAVMDGDGAELDRWSCLSCRACSDVCPADVDYTGFVRRLRTAGRAEGAASPCTHSAVFDLLPRLQDQAAERPDRLHFVTPELQVADRGPVVLFVGCAPVYDVVHAGLNVPSTDITRDAIRLLNHLGVTPVLLSDERCCGHDQYWNGEDDRFRSLAAANVAALQAAGAEVVLTTCPECSLALGTLYREALGTLPFRVQHLTQYLMERRTELPAAPPVAAGTNGAEAVTYHDPCRLARHLDDQDSPRALLATTGRELREMPRSRFQAVCCGTSGWSNCDLASKRMQRERLAEAAATGARTLVTACPKCRIHLSCANRDEGVDLAIRDVVQVLAERLPPAQA